MPEAYEFGQWEPEGAPSNCPVTTLIPTWKMLTTLDMSHNSIAQIDDSVVRPLEEYLQFDISGALGWNPKRDAQWILCLH